MARPLLAACLIVKNEAHTITRTLDSLRGVADLVAALDTGSTDQTREAIGGALVINPIHVVYEEPFTDYATARNRIIDLAAATKLEPGEGSPLFCLSLSADEILHGGENLRAFLESYTGDESAFLIEVRTETESFLYPRVIRTGSPWRYEGAIHEQLVNTADRSVKPTVVIPGVWIEHKASDPNRRLRRMQEMDIPALESAIASATDPGEQARLLILLAQTHEAIAVASTNIIAASRHYFNAFGCYSIAAHMDAAPDETQRHARFKMLNVAEVVGLYTSQEMLGRLAPLVQADPKNAALAYMAASHVAAIDASRGMAAAMQAAKVARDAVKDPAHPHDPHGLLWRSHYLAAKCAKATGNVDQMKKSAAAARDAGAPIEVTKEYDND